MPEVLLTGCRPEPLAGYLKALAILRLVSEQKDPKARGSWQGDVFSLDSALTEQQLVDFLLDDYVPTPLVAPWNGGSGFYPGDTNSALTAILATDKARFSGYQAVIKQVLDWPEIPKPLGSASELVTTLKKHLGGRKPGGKPDESQKRLAEIERCLAQARGSLETYAAHQGLPAWDAFATIDGSLKAAPKGAKGAAKSDLKQLSDACRKGTNAIAKLSRGGSKEQIQAGARARLPEAALAWLDAAFVVRSDGKTTYNPLLGTGGNEGRLDFTYNFMDWLVEIFLNHPGQRDEARLRASLFGGFVKGLEDGKIGQFDPGRAGGFNQGAGVEKKDFKINPWDYILALEGTAALAGSVTRRNGCGSQAAGAIPFSVQFTGAGFASSSPEEEGRPELWLPTWGRPTRYTELRSVFAEGRSQVGRRPARTGKDFVRAVGTLGVDRGLDGFVRYTYLLRRGKSYIALPAGRMAVIPHPELRLLDDLDPILDRLDRWLRQMPNIPASYGSLRRRLEETFFTCAESPSPVAFMELLRVAGRMEALIANHDRSRDPKLAEPLSGLRPEWMLLADDGGPEIRIAAALASIRPSGEVGPIRSNLAGVDPSKPWQWATGRAQKHWYGSGLAERLAGVLEQRLMDASRLDTPNPPFRASIGLGVSDIQAFIDGETDDALLEDLLWAFTWIDWRNRDGLAAVRKAWTKGPSHSPIPRAWCLLKLLYWPGPLDGKEIKPEARIPGLLRAGRIQEACAIAVRRLRVTGLPVLDVEYGRGELDPIRLLAALLLPVHSPDYLTRRIFAPTQQS